MKVLNQSGRAPILLSVIAATLGMGLVASAYLNYQQHEQAAQEAQLLNGTITDLRYQLNQDESASPSPSASATPTPTATPSPAVQGTQSVALSQLGVTLTTTDPVADLTYSYQLVNGLAVANLTTTSLVAKYPACKPGTALGQIVRRPLSSKASSASKLIKKLGDYNYYYVAPSGNCGSDAAGRTLVSSEQSALVNAVLPTLASAE